MKLDVERLVSERLALELPRKRGGEPHRIELGAGKDVRGEVRTGDGVVLDHVTASALDVGAVRWFLGDVPLDLGPVTLQGVMVDLRIPKGGPIGGVIEVAEITEVGGPGGRGHAVTLGPGRTAVVGRIVARRVSLRFSPDALRIDIGALELADVVVRIDEALPENQPHTVARAAEELREAERAAAFRGSVGDRALAPEGIDWRFLDALDGHVDVDVSLDVAVPVIGHRKGTHELRIPIERGVIDYKRAEHQLAAIEDALIDFELEDGRLILEKDIPLVPRDEKVLLYWALDPEERALAEEDKVRLRTLMGALKPARTPKQKKQDAEDKRERLAALEKSAAAGDPAEKKKVRVLGLDLAAVDVDLSFKSPPEPLRAPGSPLPPPVVGVSVFGRVTAQGAFHYRAEGEAPPPASLRVALDGLRIAAHDLPGQDGKRSATLRAEVPTILVESSGTVPQTLVLSAPSATFVDVTLVLPA